MRILICGGRDFDDLILFWKTMDNLSDQFDFDGNQPIVIIEGGARGADRISQMYAKECGWELETYPADWHKHGKAAGPIRNKQMLDEGKPDLVVAFPGGSGTKNMIDQATKAGVKVIKIESSN